MKTFDSWAWVEYFRGSEVGRKVKDILEGTEVLFTPAVCLAELKAKYLSEKHDPTERLQLIKSRTSIIAVDASAAEDAADLKLQHKLHMVDAIILACARSCESDLLTGDRHFRGAPGVVMLAE
jgi:predicted nucleic acid-binding protein